MEEMPLYGLKGFNVFIWLKGLLLPFILTVLTAAVILECVRPASKYKKEPEYQSLPLRDPQIGFRLGLRGGGFSTATPL